MKNDFINAYKIKIFIFCVLFSIAKTSSGQSDKWITYKNPRSNMIGRQVVGGGFAEILPSIALVDITSDEGARYSKQKINNQFKLGIGSIFNTSSTKLLDAELLDIKVDMISQNSFGKVNPNQKFVYKGIRGSKAVIKTELTKNTSLDLKKLVEQYKKLQELVPGIDIAKLIADTIRIKSEKFYTDTITDPNVYYLLQIAEFKTDLGTGKKNGRSLDKAPGNDNKHRNEYFYLSMHQDSLQSRSVTTAYNLLASSKRVKIEASLILKNIDNDLKLYLRYTEPTVNAQDGDRLIQKDFFGNDKKGKPIYKSLINEEFITRYSIGGNRFKELYLKVDALYLDNRVRFTNYDKTSSWPYRTFIFYPESKIILHSKL